MKVIDCIPKQTIFCNPFYSNTYLELEKGVAVEYRSFKSQKGLDLVFAGSLTVLQPNHILSFERDSKIKIYDPKKLAVLDLTKFYSARQARQYKYFAWNRCRNAITSIAGFLLFCCTQSNSKFIYLRQKIIASFVDLNRETVCRVLRKLMNEYGYLIYDGRSSCHCVSDLYPIKILNFCGLKMLANS